MKYITTFILFLALLAQICSRYIVVVKFEFNRNYITKNLCENRNKPGSCCKGKCYLKKQLAKSTNEENLPGKSASKNKTDEWFFHTQKPAISMQINQKTNACFLLQNTALGSYLFTNTVFHPPQA